MLEIPKMRDYDVSSKTGFLPSELPLCRLPQEYFKVWEDLVNNLPSLILTRQIRRLVDEKLKVLSTKELQGVRQYRRAYQILSFLAHAYIWGEEPTINRLPEQIAKPLIEVADVLELPPVATYSSLCLWNFKEIMPTEDGEEFWDLNNLTTINTFTGSIDESWFYLVSVFFEYKGAYAMKTGLEVIESVLEDDVEKVTNNLQKLAELIDHLGSIMMKMEEMCDPHIFYFRIRPFLAGWKNMADFGLDKDGVIYGTETIPRSYAGGSNGQSSLIQFLDILLDVNHYSTGERPLPHQLRTLAEGSKSSFPEEMRSYMPGPHRKFLERLEEISNIREYVLAHKDTCSEMTLSYDACLAMMKLFRDKHIQIVTRYIVLQAKQSTRMGSTSTLRSGLAKHRKNSMEEERGTGGTALLPFLKQCRDETGDPAAGNWGKRILSDGVMRLKYSKPSYINED
ncbi:uncharacterized protein PRCAT00000809001 [Priceomyces carsonii]|uniref:uncharacterized protein n=1 Tax=Priceomyces carsonii TaxID=28549 RepID=UPI002ED85C35|nr:unnamed protein product [Priceomyces carsonii]